jgi:flagellar hook assembly protein FlgD
VSTLADDNYDTGYHSFMWNGLDQYGNKASAGIYFYSLHTKEMTLTKKMILMK